MGAGPEPRPQVRPSGWWYLATVGIVGLGVIVAAVLLLGGYRETETVGRDRTVVELGRSGPVTFEKGGGYTLAYQGPPQATTEADVARLAAELDPVLRPAGGGAPVRMQPYSGTLGIIDDRETNTQLVPVLTFDIDRPGDYVLSVERLDGVADHFGQVSVGESIFRPLLRSLVWALIAVVIGVFFSAVATAALAVTRGRSKRQVRPPGAGPAGIGPWPAPASPPPPPGYG